MSDFSIQKPADLEILHKVTSLSPKKTLPTEPEKLQKVAKDFEAMFMDLVMKQMRESSVFESDVEGDSQHVKFYQSLLDTEYTKEVGQSGKLGIADTMVRQLTRQQINGETIK